MFKWFQALTECLLNVISICKAHTRTSFEVSQHAQMLSLPHCPISHAQDTSLSTHKLLLSFPCAARSFTCTSGTRHNMPSIAFISYLWYAKVYQNTFYAIMMMIWAMTEILLVLSFSILYQRMNTHQYCLLEFCLKMLSTLRNWLLNHTSRKTGSHFICHITNPRFQFLPLYINKEASLDAKMN